MYPNIDPLYFLTPTVVIGVSVGLAVYWWFKRRFTRMILLYSALAYFSAILLKYLVQEFTYHELVFAVHSNPYALGAYFGIQTVVFEVFLAYLVARYAASRGELGLPDGVSYGLGLALWENGVLVSIPALLEYVAFYVLLSFPHTNASMYNMIYASFPDLFLPPLQALRLVGFAVLERISSIMLHFSWGYLAVLAAVLGRRTYLYIALPMGLVDSLVPFESTLGLLGYEGSVFGIALASLLVTWVLASRSKGSSGVGGTKPNSAPMDPLSLGWLNFKRSLNYSRMYVVIGIVLPVLLALEFKFVVRRSELALTEIYPLILPLTTVLGSMGGLWLFTTDRVKGVHEYLIAYGIDGSTLFLSTVLATVFLATLVLVPALVIMVAVYFVSAVPITASLLKIILLYTVPLGYSSPMFMCVSGMSWSALAKQRAGVNGPVGLAPILGIAPVLVATLLSALVGPNLSVYVAALVSTVVFALSVVIAIWGGGRMVRERFLSTE
ncbi:MAG: hypothetical protein QW514_03265 [Thermoprotei archaeon]